MSKSIRVSCTGHAKTAFTAAVEVRRYVLILAMKEAHRFPSKQARRHENEILLRISSQNDVINKLIEELEELDDIICNLSKFI